MRCRVLVFTNIPALIFILPLKDNDRVDCWRVIVTRELFTRMLVESCTRIDFDKAGEQKYNLSPDISHKPDMSQKYIYKAETHPICHEGVETFH